jgi:ribosomal protein S18 acetylase RimI-like enzyme
MRMAPESSVAPAAGVHVLAHGELGVATRIHAIQMLAYAQEAKLLGAIYFPPLQRTVRDIQGSAESYLGVFEQGTLVGALSHWPDEEGLGTNIASLVVHPAFQRRGFGRALLASFMAARAGDEITVQTGARNGPALALYGQHGFVEHRRWFVGREPLELVKLRRPAGGAQGVARTR